MTVVLVPFAVMVPEAALIVEAAALAAPGIKVITSSSVSEEALIEPVIVAVPVVVGDVTVTVYVPLPLSVTEESVPAVVDNTGKHAPEVILPAASFNCMVTVDVLTPFATMEEGTAEINVCAVVDTENFAVLLGKPMHAPLLTSRRK